MAGYGSDPDLAAWLAGMGYVLPSGAPSPAVLRQRGSAYLDATYEGLWSGQRSGGIDQERGWPRTGATIACTTPIPDDAIPVAIVHASYRAAWLDASNPGSLSASVTTGGRVRRQKVDVIEREFFDDGSSAAGEMGAGFLDSEIDGAMKPFICDKSHRFVLLSAGGRCCG